MDPIKEQEGEGGEGEFDVDYKGIGRGNDPRNKRKIQEIIEKVPITVRQGHMPPPPSVPLS